MSVGGVGAVTPGPNFPQAMVLLCPRTKVWSMWELSLALRECGPCWEAFFVLLTLSGNALKSFHSVSSELKSNKRHEVTSPCMHIFCEAIPFIKQHDSRGWPSKFTQLGKGCSSF